MKQPPLLLLLLLLLLGCAFASRVSGGQKRRRRRRTVKMFLPPPPPSTNGEGRKRKGNGLQVKFMRILRLGGESKVPLLKKRNFDAQSNGPFLGEKNLFQRLTNQLLRKNQERKPLFYFFFRQEEGKRAQVDKPLFFAKRFFTPSILCKMSESNFIHDQNKY